jgi:hypothetical protein
MLLAVSSYSQFQESNFRFYQQSGYKIFIKIDDTNSSKRPRVCENSAYDIIVLTR